MWSALRCSALTACFAVASASVAQQSQPAATSTTEEATNAAKTGMEALADPASLTATAPAAFKVKFMTTAGDFVVDVERDWSPAGADRFYNLVRNGFYDDTAFFRVVPGFMAQFGLSGHPKINAAMKSATLPDEPVKQSNTRGFVSFAKQSMPNTRTTQLFINYGDNSRLDGMGFSPFGKVSEEGMKVVDAINSQYREQPAQARIQSQGNEYLRGAFPELTYILAATILD